MPKQGKLNRSAAIRAFLATKPKSTPKEIVAAMKGKGIEVTMGLANMIRYSKRRRSLKPTRRKQARLAQAAKTAGMNKSQAVRDYLAKHPTANAKAIQEALKAKGIKISVGLASAVKYAKKKGPGRPRRRRAGRPFASTRNGSLRMEDLLQAKKFANRVGGVATDLGAGNSGFTVSVHEQGIAETYSPAMNPASMNNNPAA